MEKTSSFILLDRKIMDWQWYSNPNVMRLFIHCLLKANFKSKKWRDVTIERGTFITSYAKLADELYLTRDQVRGAFKKLIDTKEVTTQGNNQYLTVTICKYNDYQANKKGKEDDGTTQNPHESHTDTNQIPTTNNDNNANNENNYSSTTSVREICFENKVWVEAVKSNYVLTQPQFDMYLDKFTNHAITQGKTTTCPADFKKHFISWYKKHTGKGMGGKKQLRYTKPTL